MPQTLPFDILEIIIDLLAAEDDQNSTLVKPCSLLCHSLVYCCRKYIFRTITIGLPTDSTNYSPGHLSLIPSRLCWLISHAPHIANYVRVLKVGLSEGPTPYDKCRKFPRVLRQFTNIESLTLDVLHASRDEKPTTISWKQVKQPIKDATLSLIQLGTLKSLTLRRIRGFPISEITFGVKLRSLHIFNVQILDYDSPHANSTPRQLVHPIQLHEYSAAGHASPQQTTAIFAAKQFDNQTPVFDLSQLQYLRIEDHFLPLDVITSGTLKRAAQVARHMKKRYYYYEDSSAAAHE